MKISNRYDIENWNAETYRSPKEVRFILEHFNVLGKKIHHINVIGYVPSADRATYYQNFSKTLNASGLTLNDLTDDMSIVPQEIIITEPVVIVFDDNTTLEFFPTDYRSLKISVNQISPTLKDGVNASNFNANCFFKNIINTCIKNVTHRTKNEDSYIEFELDSGLVFYIKNRTWHHSIGVCTSSTENSSYITPEVTTVQHFKESVIQRNQVLINDSYEFYVGAFRASDKTVDFMLSSSLKHKFTLTEETVYSFLIEFFVKYFDATLTKVYRTNELNFEDEFDGYGVNIYSNESIKKILAEIKHYVHLLKTDYDNPELDLLKSRFDVYEFVSYYDYPCQIPDKEKLIQKNIHVAIDFYERFCFHMQKMLETSPDCLIAVVGP